MARPGISYQDVVNVIDTIISEGESPTIKRIRAVLGTGSPNTIHRHLSTWRKTVAPTQERKSELSTELQTAIMRELERRSADLVAEVKKLRDELVQANAAKTVAEQAAEEAINAYKRERELNGQLRADYQQLIAELRDKVKRPESKAEPKTQKKDSKPLTEVWDDILNDTNDGTPKKRYKNDLVRVIKDMMKAGRKTPGEIAKYFNSIHFKTFDGERWKVAHVKALLN